MMVIPGIFISLITFPGVVVHELAHVLFCWLTKTAVYEVKYLRFKNPVGYVIHEKPKKATHQILIAVGPFFVNSIIGFLIAFTAAPSIIQFNAENGMDFLLMWLGLSIAMHAFPSSEDAKSIWMRIKEEDVNFFVKIFATPIVGLIYLVSAFSYFWLDLVYGGLVVGLLPMLIIRLLSNV